MGKRATTARFATKDQVRQGLGTMRDFGFKDIFVIGGLLLIYPDFRFYDGYGELFQFHCVLGFVEIDADNLDLALIVLF